MMAGNAESIIPTTTSKIKIVNCFLLFALKKRTVAIETKTKSSPVIILIIEGFAPSHAKAIYLNTINKALKTAEIKKFRYVFQSIVFISDLFLLKHKPIPQPTNTINIWWNAITSEGTSESLIFTITKVNASAVAEIIENITHAIFLVGLIFLFNTANSVAANKNAKPTKNRTTLIAEPPLVTVLIIKITNNKFVKNKIREDSKGEKASRCDLFKAKK